MKEQVFVLLIMSSRWKRSDFS